MDEYKCSIFKMAEPGTKKRRMESPIREDSEGIVDEKAEIERLITLMNVSTQNLKPVLADDLVGELPTVNVYVGTVIERKSIYKIIVSLTSLLPLTELQHLKRARNTEILICPSDGENIGTVTASLKDKGFDLKTHLQDDFKIVAVASKPPQLKWQHEKAHKIWPCNFHPNKYKEKLVSGEFFSKSDVERHRKYMTLAYEVAEVYEGIKDRSEEVLSNVASFEKAASKRIAEEAEKDELILVKDTLLPLESIRKELAELKGVLIVDPELDSIVAVGYDRRTTNPCQHPVMIAIDNVARSQFGGAWNDNSMFAEETPEERSLNCEELVKDGVPKMFRNILNTSHADLKFGAKRSIRRGEIPNETADSYFGKDKDGNATTVKDEHIKRSKTIRDTKVSGKKNSDTSDEDMEQRKSFGSSTSISSQSVSFSEDSGPSKPSGPYLCTGYDVYTTNEPCIMCSMALVHSRARRVMFSLKNEENGALSSTKLHTIQALNHRYEVFTGFFEEPLS